MQQNITHQLETQINSLNNRLNLYNNDIKLRYASYEMDYLFNLYSDCLNSKIDDQIKRTNYIIEHLKNSLNGELTQLIPEKKLTKDLIYIKSQLSDSQILPVDLDTDSSIYIYKASSISCAIYEKRLLLKIQFPVPEKENFIVYNIIPLPIKINNEMKIIKPSANFLLMNNNNTKYVFVSQQELSLAKIDSIENKIVPIQYIETDFSQNCETNILTQPNRDIVLSHCQFEIIQNENIFYPINLPNSYYVTVQSPVSFSEICQNAEPKNVTLTKSGILELESGCHIITNNIIFYPKTNYDILTNENIFINNFINHLSFIEKINNTYSLSISEQNDTIHNQTSYDFSSILNKGNELLHEANKTTKFSELKTENIFNWILKDFYNGIKNILSKSAIWILGFILVIIIVFLLCCCNCFKCFNCFKCMSKNIL